jgi:hypothetical protein
MGYRIRVVPEVETWLAAQLAEAPESGDEDVAVPVRAEASVVAGQIDELRRLCAAAQSDERRAMTASMRLQRKVDDFRIRKEAAIAAEATVAAADLAVWAEAMIGDVGPRWSCVAGTVTSGIRGARANVGVCLTISG